MEEARVHGKFAEAPIQLWDAGVRTATGELEARIAYLEQLIAATMGGGEAAQPFIGSDLVGMPARLARVIQLNESNWGPAIPK